MCIIMDLDGIGKVQRKSELKKLVTGLYFSLKAVVMIHERGKEREGQCVFGCECFFANNNLFVLHCMS